MYPLSSWQFEIISRRQTTQLDYYYATMWFVDADYSEKKTSWNLRKPHSVLLIQFLKKIYSINKKKSSLTDHTVHISNCSQMLRSKLGQTEITTHNLPIGWFPHCVTHRSIQNWLGKQSIYLSGQKWLGTREKRHWSGLSQWCSGLVEASKNCASAHQL